MIATLLALFFLLTTILFGYSSIISMRKVEQYEDWTVNASNQIESVLRQMHRIDESGVFKSDDEVGETFDKLVSVVNELQILVYDQDDSP